MIIVMSEPESTGLEAKYLNLCNPLGPQASDLPLLLRRFADLLEQEEVGSEDILHIVVGDEMTEYGSWWDITAYYDDSDTDDAETDAD